jgi:cytoskeletal protein CcmA (bactofilin family)
MFGKNKGVEAGITLIANNCELSGDVHFSDHLLVNGVVKGNIVAQPGSKAVVTISEKGRVKGEIRVPNVIVNGKVFGDIYSDKHVELAARAEIKGNVYYNLIDMVKGSKVDGNLVHLKQSKDLRHETHAATEATGGQHERAATKAAAVAAVKTKSNQA